MVTEFSLEHIQTFIFADIDLCLFLTPSCIWYSQYCTIFSFNYFSRLNMDSRDLRKCPAVQLGPRNKLGMWKLLLAQNTLSNSVSAGSKQLSGVTGDIYINCTQSWVYQARANEPVSTCNTGSNPPLDILC